MILMLKMVCVCVLLLTNPVRWGLTDGALNHSFPESSQESDSPSLEEPSLGGNSEPLLDRVMEKVAFLQPRLLRSKLSCGGLAEFYLVLPPFAKDLCDLVMLVLYGALGCREEAGSFLANLIDDLGTNTTVSLLEETGARLSEHSNGTWDDANPLAQGACSLGVRFNVQQITSCVLEIAKYPRKGRQSDGGAGAGARACSGIQYANGSSLRGSVLSSHGEWGAAEAECRQLRSACAGVQEAPAGVFAVLGRNDSYSLPRGAGEGSSWIQQCRAGRRPGQVSKRGAEHFITVFKQPNFLGESAVFPESVEFVGEEWSCSISSLKVDACSACTVTVCRGPGFTGPCTDLASSSQLIVADWVNSISSLRVQAQCSVQLEQQLHQTLEYIPYVSYFYNLATSIYYYSVDCYFEAEERVESIIQDLGLDLANSLTGAVAQVTLFTVKELHDLASHAAMEAVKEGLQEAVHSVVENTASLPAGDSCRDGKGRPKDKRRKCKQGGGRGKKPPHKSGKKPHLHKPSKKQGWGQDHGKKGHPKHSKNNHKDSGHSG